MNMLQNGYYSYGEVLVAFSFALYARVGVTIIRKVRYEYSYTHIIHGLLTYKNLTTGFGVHRNTVPILRILLPLSDEWILYFLLTP